MAELYQPKLYKGREDFAGRTVGHWVVLAYLGSAARGSPVTRTSVTPYWKCRCSRCGHEQTLNSQVLKRYINRNDPKWLTRCYACKQAERESMSPKPAWTPPQYPVLIDMRLAAMEKQIKALEKQVAALKIATKHNGKRG